MAVINPFREPAGPVNPLMGSGGESNPFREQPQPHVTAKITYGEQVEDESDVGWLSPITEASKGFWSSLTSGNVEMLGAAAEAVSVALGNDKPEQSIGRNVQNWIRERTDQEDFPISWDEAKGEGPLGILSYLTGMTGSAVGSTVAPMAAGLLGAKAGTLALPGPGTAVGAIAGAFSTGAMLSIGETYSQLINEGVDPDTASKAALSVGTGIGVIETVGVGKLLGKTVGKEIKKKTIKEIAKRFGKGYVEGATTEGITETAQSAIREATAASLTGDVKLKERALSALHEGFAGALGGGLIRGSTVAGRAALAPDPAAPPSVAPAPTPEAAPAPQPVVPAPTPEAVTAPQPVVPAPGPEAAPATPPPVVPAPTPEAVPVTQPAPPEPNPFRDPAAPAPTPPVVPSATPEPVQLPVSQMEGPVGKETMLHTPESEIRARYRLSEAGTLQPSHDPVTFGKNVNYPEGVQERLYHSNKDAQAEVIKTAQDFKPARVINSDPTAINGPPQATPSGVVIGGNQRDMATQRMYLDGNGEKYRQYLLEHAEEFGFTKDDVLSLKNPELWREILDAPADVEGMRVLGSDLNKDFKKALSEVEQAVTAGKNLSKESADAFAVEFEKLGEKGTLRKTMASSPLIFRDALLRDGVLSETDLPKYFTGEGAVNEAGKTFIEKAMVGSVIQDADLLQSMPKSLVAKVLRIVPQMIETGKRSDKWNITEDVKDAVRQVSSAHIRGIKLEDQLGQVSMFGEGPTPEVKALARLMLQKELEISGIFKEFAGEARTDKPGQDAMFGKADPVESFGRIFGAKPGAPDEVAAAMEETLAFAAGRPTLPSLPTTGMPKELVRRSEILEKLSKELNGLPIRLGRISKPRALGIYKPKAEVVRLRQAGDIPVAMHEVGHHLNKLMYGGTEGKLNTAPLNEYSDELGKIATKGPKKSEGFAEFVRLYLTDPGAASDAAPRFHAAFEKKMAEMPELQDVLHGTRQRIRSYIEQPDSVKAMSNIRRSSDLPRARWSLRQIYTDIFNKLNPVEKTVEEMERRKGEKLPTEKNAGDLAQLVSGWADRAGMYMNDATFDIDGKVNGKGLKETLDPILRSGQREQFDAYLSARRIIALSKRGIKQGLTPEQAKNTIRELETPEFIEAAKEVYGFEDRLLDLRVQGGLVTQEEADAYRKANPDYVPLYKFFPEEGKGKNAAGTGFLNLGGGKRIGDSGREVISPLENIVADVESTIRDVDHHAAVVAFVEQASKVEGGGQFAEKVPAKMTGTKIKLKELKKVLKENGVDTEGMSAESMEAVATIFRPDMRPDPGDNIVVVRRKGERELWQLDPEVHKALNSGAPVSSNIFTKVLRGGAATLRTTATGTSLEFPMMNFFRDTAFAGLVSPDRFIPVASSIKGTMSYLANDETYKEFMRAGGGLSTNVEVALHQMGKSNNPLKKTPVMNAFQALTFLSRVSEMGTRVGYYNVARKAGKTPKTAALEAKDLLNFSRWGAATEAAARYAPFWNSALQGTDKFRRALTEDPKGVTARGVAMLTVPAILLYAANLGNEDYEEAPTWLKDLYFLIPTFDKKTPFIRIPKPHLPGMLFASLPERAMEFARTRDPEAFDGAIGSLLQTLLPGMGGVPVPSLAIPVVEGITNYSFFRGRPIVSQAMENLPAELQSQPWTTELAKETSKMLAAGGVKMSPLIIENTLFGITASTGRTVATALNPFLRDKDAPERPSMHWGDMPVARAFAVRPISGKSTRRLYDRLDKLKGMKAAEDLTLKHRWIEAKSMSKAERWEYGILKKAQKLMSDIYGKIRKVESSQKLSGEEKREQIDKWSARRSKIAADTMAKIRKLKQ